jgi:hypothetical protein
MDLNEYTEMLRREVASVTKFGGEEFARTAEMLADALESSVRLTLLEVLSAAAAEITTQLDGAAIDVRLSGGEPEFVVTTPPGEQEDVPTAGPEPGDASDDMTRITLRLPSPLKAKVDDAAAAAGVSVNAWLVRNVIRELEGPRGGSSRTQRGPGIGSRFTGYARG